MGPGVCSGILCGGYLDRRCFSAVCWLFCLGVILGGGAWKLGLFALRLRLLAFGACGFGYF